MVHLPPEDTMGQSKDQTCSTIARAPTVLL